MAKFFKVTPSSGSAAPKPLFERDFFDMTQEVTPPVLPLTPSVTPPISGPAKDVDAPTSLADTDGQQSPMGSRAKAKVSKTATGSAVRRAPGKKHNPGTLGNTPQPGVPPLPTAMNPAEAGKLFESPDVRQTFVLTKYHLEQIRDHVHARRSQGDYNYSQKQLLQEALSLFMASQNSVPPRPTELREREKQLRIRIQEGRQANASQGQSTEPGKAV